VGVKPRSPLDAKQGLTRHPEASLALAQPSSSFLVKPNRNQTKVRITDIFAEHLTLTFFLDNDRRQDTAVVQVTIVLNIYGQYLSVLLYHVWLEASPRLVVISRKLK
jgi:hypothetical protein